MHLYKNITMCEYLFMIYIYHLPVSLDSLVSHRFLLARLASLPYRGQLHCAEFTLLSSVTMLQ